MTGTIDILLLALLVAELGWLFFHRSPAPPRSRRFLVWIGRAWLRYALTSILVLVVIGRLDALWTLPAEFDGMVALLGSSPGDPWLMATFAGGIVGGMVIADAVAMWRQGWRGRRRRWLPDYSQLEAQPGERGAASLLALTAGLVEEPFFRLALPLLIARVTGDAVAGFVIAVVLFGLAHRYQGWKGIVLTMVSGAVLTILYVQTGSLLFAAVMHAAIDFNLLVIQPALVRLVVNSSSASRS